MKRYEVTVNSTCGLTGELMGGKEKFEELEEAEAYFERMKKDAQTSNDDTDVTLKDREEHKIVSRFENYED